KIRAGHWRRGDLQGVPVLLAGDTGPAVVGLARPSIVIPEWALSMDDAAQRRMLRHEAEHIRAHDPQLTLIAVLLVVLFPWNAGLWIALRRFRLAVELDCDQRVLRATDELHSYGLLLLAVGAGATTPFQLAVPLGERRPSVERRIRAMTAPRSRRPRVA